MRRFQKLLYLQVCTTQKADAYYVYIKINLKWSKMHPVPQGLLYFFSTDFVFSRMFHSSKQFDATNMRFLAFGRSIYSAHEVLKYSDSCSRKQLHVKVYKYLQVQYEINETSQTSLHQCKKKKKEKQEQEQETGKKGWNEGSQI